MECHDDDDWDDDDWDDDDDEQTPFDRLIGKPQENAALQLVESVLLRLVYPNKDSRRVLSSVDVDAIRTVFKMARENRFLGVKPLRVGNIEYKGDNYIFFDGDIPQGLTVEGNAALMGGTFGGNITVNNLWMPATPEERKLFDDRKMPSIADIDGPSIAVGDKKFKVCKGMKVVFSPMTGKAEEKEATVFDSNSGTVDCTSSSLILSTGNIDLSGGVPIGYHDDDPKESE